MLGITHIKSSTEAWICTYGRINRTVSKLKPSHMEKLEEFCTCPVWRLLFWQVGSRWHVAPMTKTSQKPKCSQDTSASLTRWYCRHKMGELMLMTLKGLSALRFYHKIFLSHNHMWNINVVPWNTTKRRLLLTMPEQGIPASEVFELWPGSSFSINNQ